MDQYWKVTAMILLALVMGIMLERQERDLSVLLTVLVCCAAATAALSCLEPVWGLIYELKALTQIRDDVMEALLKVIGIALVSEVLSTVCADAGNASLGKGLQFMGSAVILYLSVPILRAVIASVQDILGVL